MPENKAGRTGRSPALSSVLCLSLCCLAAAQEVSPSAAEVAAAIDRLGEVDYATRTGASRTIRRAPANLAVPALVKAVGEHKDGFVRYRALVLLSGFSDPRTADVMIRALGDPNDRLREVAYRHFEHHPDRGQLPRLLSALETEVGEFVRPALVRALAAQAGDARVRDVLLGEIGRGQDHFRGAVIEGLGDHGGTFAIGALLEIAAQDGPLQDDAILALGRLGDRRALELMARLQRTAPRSRQPILAAAICMLGTNCAGHLDYLDQTVRFAQANEGFTDMLRAAASGLAALAGSGQLQALQVILDLGIPSRDPAREALAIALATVALKDPDRLRESLEKRADLEAAVTLLQEGFEMLEEDYEEERFFVAVRRAYWKAPDGSRAREVAELLIRRLGF